MSSMLRYGKVTWTYEDFDPALPCRPIPCFETAPVWHAGKAYPANLGDRTLLLLLKRKMPQEVSFERAYRGWIESGMRERQELGEGRAFFRWLQRHSLSIQWRKKDFRLHPYFLQSGAPRHNPSDPMAQGLNFALAPAQVGKRKVKLYLRDEDILRLLHMPFGQEVDLMELVTRYIAQRFIWQEWHAPAPLFVDWVAALGLRVLVKQGQLGFSSPAALG
jgi:hypothetical protein